MAIFVLALYPIALLVNAVFTCDTIWGCKNIKMRFFKLIILLFFLSSCFLLSLLYLGIGNLENFFPILFLFHHITLFFSVKVITKTKSIKIVYVCLFYVFSTALFSTSTILFLGVFGVQFTEFETIDGALSLLFNVLCIIMMSVFRRGKIIKNIQTKVELIPSFVYILILLTILALSGFIAFQNMRIADYETQIVLLRVFSLAIIPVLIMMVIFLIVNSVLRRISEDTSASLKKQVEMQVKHYEQIEKKNADLRGFKHDYKNHMLCLKSMLESQSCAEAVEYIENLGDFFPIIPKNFDTGNYIADALFDEKNTLCIQKDISLECKGIIPFGRIGAVDLCTLLSNLLDNAIEACEKITQPADRKIKAVLDFKNEHLFISISNTVHEQVRIRNNFISTTKENKAVHGIGLMNIQRVVEKYGGNLKMQCSDETFKTEIVVPLL